VGGEDSSSEEGSQELAKVTLIGLMVDAFAFATTRKRLKISVNFSELR